MKKLILIFVWFGFIARGQVIPPPLCLNYLTNITTPSVGTTPYALTNADFNLDGLTDLAVANYTSANVSILKGTGNGVFAPAVNYAVGVGPCSIKHADLNNDGKPDLVTANKVSNNVSVLFGLAGGTFSTAINYLTGNNPNSVFLADFNNDTYKDIVVANYGSNTISVLLGSPTGTFSLPNIYPVGTNPNHVLSADFNNDGKLDLAVTHQNSNNLYILLGDGLGAFTQYGIYNNGFGINSLSVMVPYDFNSDGKLDLAIANTGYNSGVSLFLGNGNGGFAFTNAFNVGGQARSVLAYDLNGDSKMDLATISASSDITVLLGDGLGSFTQNGYYNSGPNPTDFITTDFNGDTKTDLAITNSTSNKLSIVFGNGNGSFLTSINYFSGYVGGKMCRADFNGDGKMDIVACNPNYMATLLGTGTGSFNTSFTINNIYANGSIITNDFNNDGIPDVATCGYTSSTHSVTMLLGLGNGSFTTSFYGQGLGADPIDLTSADFNGDGKKDIATSNISGNTISILLGTGTGSFTFGNNYVSGPGRSIKNADFNGDGFIDLVVGTGNTAKVFLGNGNGTFMPGVNYNVGTDVYCVITGDFNNDGDVDIATANHGSSNVSILKGSSTGTFSSLGNYPISAPPVQLYSDDLNGDGKLDIVTGNYYPSTSISVLLGHGTGFFSAATDYNIGGSASHFTTADFNADGKKDLALVDGLTTKIFLSGIAPSVSVSGPTLTCAGYNITLSATGGNYYNWSTGATTSSVLVTPTVNTTYSVVASSITGCAVTGIKTISVTPGPTITVNSGSICFGNSYVINPTGASSFSFSSGSATVSPTSTSSFTVSGTNTLGCISSAICNVTVNPLPIISVNDGTICPSQSFTMLPSGANTYTFSSGTAIVSPAANTSYSVTGTSLAGCVSAGPAISNVSVSSSPAPTITVNSGIICAGNSFTINPSGANSYTISGGSAIVSPSATTSYSVIGTNTSGCISSSSAVSTITINTFSVSVNSGTICNGSSFTLNPSGANTYTISAGNTIVSPTTTSTYSVTGTSSLGCLSSNTAVASVIVNPTPTVTAPGGTICLGGSFLMQPIGANSYTYSSITQNFSPTATAVYTITGATNNGCMNSTTISVIVNQPPVISLNSGSVCSGNSFTLMPSGANTYTFSSGNAVVSPIINTTYSVTGTSTAGCVTNTPAVTTITVNTVPVITSAISGNSVMCTGSGLTNYSIAPVSGATLYTWTLPAGWSGTSSSNTIISTPGAGSGTIYVTANNICGSSLPQALTATVNPLPNITAVSNTSILCAGQPAILTANGAATYTWSTGSNSVNIVITPSVTTSYTLNGTDVNGCNNLTVVMQNVSICTDLTTLSAAQKSILIFPNPVSSTFEIRLSPSYFTEESDPKLDIVNSLGQIVFTTNIKEPSTNYNIQSFANGVYFVKITTAYNQVNYKKIILQK